ncbi:MAG: RluA family pseudouridine synthase [Propionibacteriaceae bacterium]|nr:RluA family pseudouridine synthase [Propionibacteriaceae bacterium]
MVVAIVPEGLADLRADVGAARIFGISRSRVEQAADGGSLLVDGKPVAKSHRLSAGALVEMTIEDSPPISVHPTLAPGLDIVYDDADIVVVDKPAGVAAHPSLGWQGPSVVEHLAAAGFVISTTGPPERQGIVSRLDVGTSGLMVVAKTDMAYVKLKQSFTARVVHKIYHGMVQGYLRPESSTIHGGIAHTKTSQWKMEVSAQGREAVTHYQVLETVLGASLVELKLETGRTHQIRVHMAYMRHPLVGDLLYGGDPQLGQRLGLERQWLHAVELGFTHPRSGESMTFTSPYREDLRQALEQLRQTPTDD